MVRILMLIVLICLCAACATNEMNQAKPVFQGHVETVEEFYAAMTGSWEGSYTLWLRPGLPAEESKTCAEVKPVVQDRYHLMSYNWAQGEKEHEGLFFLGGKDDQAGFAWGDSFHTLPEPMQCPGRLARDEKKLIFNGTYSMVPGAPEWGWRTEFSLLGSNGFLMEAYNITPDGQEMLAVRADMKRVVSRKK